MESQSLARFTLGWKGSGVLGVKFALLEQCALLFGCYKYSGPKGDV